MKINTLSNCVFQTESGVDVELDEISVIRDDNSKVIILPLLHAMFMARTGTAIRWQRLQDTEAPTSRSEMSRNPIGLSSIRAYMSCLFGFLKYVNANSSKRGWPTVHETHRCDDAFVNSYLNNVLPNMAKSPTSLGVAQSALTAYFNFLEYLEIRPRLALSIFRRTNQLIAERDDRPRKISYISRDHRAALLRTCKSKCERLIFRTGYELGLRAAENRGLVLSGSDNLADLFGRLDDDRYSTTERFAYFLQGKYTKGGRSRWLYLDRKLLLDMRDYFRTERLEVMGRFRADESESLFLTADASDGGRPISARHPSNVFAKRKPDVPYLDQNLSYHDLRHTFATELYHSELIDNSGRETRSESAALLVVSERLGHSLGRDGYASDSTKRYIRLRDAMRHAEGMATA